MAYNDERTTKQLEIWCKNNNVGEYTDEEIDKLYEATQSIKKNTTPNNTYFYIIGAIVVIILIIILFSWYYSTGKKVIVEEITLLDQINDPKNITDSIDVNFINDEY